MKSFHFSLGDSNEGAIGFCARVTAESAEQAVQMLQEALPESRSIPWSNPNPGGAFIEYIEVYFNSEAISEESIDEEDDAEDEDDHGT